MRGDGLHSSRGLFRTSGQQFIENDEAFRAFLDRLFRKYYQCRDFSFLYSQGAIFLAGDNLRSLIQSFKEGTEPPTSLNLYFEQRVSRGVKFKGNNQLKVRAIDLKGEIKGEYRNVYEEVINQFNLNCYRIAYDIRKHQFYYPREYMYFEETKQVQLSFITGIQQSIKEISRAAGYINKTQEVNIALTVSNSIDKRNTTQNQLAIFMARIEIQGRKVTARKIKKLLRYPECLLPILEESAYSPEVFDQLYKKEFSTVQLKTLSKTMKFSEVMSYTQEHGFNIFEVFHGILSLKKQFKKYPKVMGAMLQVWKKEYGVFSYDSMMKAIYDPEMKNQLQSLFTKTRADLEFPLNTINVSEIVSPAQLISESRKMGNCLEDRYHYENDVLDKYRFFVLEGKGRSIIEFDMSLNKIEHKGRFNEEPNSEHKNVIKSLVKIVTKTTGGIF